MNEAVLNSTESDLCFLIGGYLIHEKLTSSLIDQQWMLEKLEKWFDHKISRSTLCENLKHLVADGMIKRITRHRRNPETGKFEPRVTCFVMTFKLKAFFLRIAARMRGIGWLNYITKAKRRVREESKRAIEAARAAALPTISADEARRNFWHKHYPDYRRT